MAADRRFELFLAIGEDATYIRGPFWNSLCRSHKNFLHEDVTFILIKKVEEDDQYDEGSEDEEDEEGYEAEEDEVGYEEDVQEEKPLDRAEYVSQMKAHATNGDIKEFDYIPGICVVSHQMYVLAAIWNHLFNIDCILHD
jgi:hypothetical protein